MQTTVSTLSSSTAARPAPSGEASCGMMVIADGLKPAARALAMRAGCSDLVGSSRMSRVILSAG